MARSGWPITGHAPRPYDVADLARALGLDPADTHALALAVGVGRRWVRRYRTVGLTEAQADRWATRAGLHALDVWPRWSPGHCHGAARANAARTRCPQGHPYDAHDNRGRRVCRPCIAERVRRHRARRAKTQARTVVTEVAA